MRTIIAGSRGITDPAAVARAMSSLAWSPTVVLSGTARGADRLGERWAEENGVPVERYPADWNTHPRAAGVIRNREMAERADALVALWDGKSRGTRHMIDAAHDLGLRVRVFNEQGEAP